MPPGGDTWAAGDYRRVARLVLPVAEAVVSAGERTAGSLDTRRVLDVGCGTGAVARAAASRGARVTGVDISPTLLDQAAVEAGSCTPAITWEVADMHSLPADDASFDVVLSSLAVIFAHDPSAAVAEIGRVLRPGGVLALSTWAAMPEDPLSYPLAEAVSPRASADDAWGGPDSVEATLRPIAAVTVTACPLRIWFAHLDDAMAFVFRDSPAHLAALGTLTTDDYLRVQRRFEQALVEHQQDDGSVAYDRPFLVACGRRR